MVSLDNIKPLEETILRNYGGVDINSLQNKIDFQLDDETDNTPNFTISSPYFDMDEMMHFIEINRNKFKILSLNCQSLNAKFDEFKIFLNKFHEIGS